jgi:hypothetical protein
MWRDRLFISILLLAGAQLNARAQTDPAAADPAATPPSASLMPELKTETETGAVLNAPKRRGPIRREKEAEGTEARDRFEIDSIIKSRYRLDGQALEVDTD